MRRRFADVITGAAAALVVFGAVPSVLVALVGLPFPRQWTRAQVVAWHGLFDLLAVVAWVAWAACCWPLLRSVAGRVRRGDATAPAGARLPEWLATRIAAAVLAVAGLGAAVGTSTGALPSRPVAVAQSQLAAGSPAGAVGQPALSGPTGPAADGEQLPTEYTVVAGDSLWSIAQRLYDDGADWTAIAGANLGQLMDDGTRFVDPGLIRPGWVLTVPALGPSPGPEAAAAPPAPPTPITEASVAGPNGGAPRPAGVGVAAGAGGGASGTGGDAAAADAPQRRRAGPGPAPLPELAAHGFGALVAAALARRARQARHLASLQRPEGEAPPPVTEAAAEAGTLLAPFLGAPALDYLELANRHLGASLAGADRAEPARLVVVGPHGVEVRFKGPVGRAPDGWAQPDDHTWTLPAAADARALAEEAVGHDPWLPLIVPVGDNDDGTWLIPLGAGDCLPVLGPDAQPMVSAMAAVLGSWAWSEGVVVTDDPSAAEREAPPAGPDGLADHGAQVLFTGDPGRLSPEGRARVATVTTLPVPSTDLTVVIDARAASIHPLGVTVRPNLLRGTERHGVEELLATTEPQPRRGPPSPSGADPSARRPPRRRAAPRASWTPAQVIVAAEAAGVPVGTGPDVAGFGGVEVRLLTAVPRLDGLVAELEPKRARRATELVAYLALHHPDPVTSDRLRTRVLGSADADAAAKTLFNTVGAARRAMGRDEGGEPLLPPASKSGHYRVSAQVTTDVARAEALAAAAEDAEDEEGSIALLRAALDLVEGEPLAGVLSGYGWWGAEGHERRIAATLVDGACRLARMAADHGYIDLARWGLEQARLVEPYSEVLSRAAMRVAAVAGDAERLRREWVECQRRVDEIDPGGLPSEATERLYADLRRRVPARAGSDAEP